MGQEDLDAAQYGTGGKKNGGEQIAGNSSTVEQNKGLLNLEISEKVPGQESAGENQKETSLEDPMHTVASKEKVDLSGTDQGASNSDSSASFGTKMKMIIDGKTAKQNTGLDVLSEIDEGANRYSSRLASKGDSDVSVMDKAKSIARAKNNINNAGGNSISLPTVLNSTDDCLVDIARLIGIDLGASIDMVEHNLSLVRGQEHARVNVFMNSKRVADQQNHEQENAHLEDVDAFLLDLLNLPQHDCEEMEDSYLDRCPERILRMSSTSDIGRIQIKTPVKINRGKKGGSQKVVK